MLQPVLEFFPAFLFFFVAMASLVMDFRKRSTLAFMLGIQAVALLLAMSQVIAPPAVVPGSNLIASPPNAFMVIVCLFNSLLVTTTTHGDFKDGTVDKFTHALVFLILGTQGLFIYTDNLFIAGTCAFTTFMFLSLLKFIYPSIEKRTLNVLVSIMTTGYVLFMVGCLVTYQLAGDVNIHLSTMDLDAVPDVGRWLLFAGLLVMAATFPFSMAVHGRLFTRSHVSVKMLDVLFFAVIYWKFVHVLLAAGLATPVTTTIMFLAGIAGVLAGAAIIVKEIDKESKDIITIITGAIIIDFSWMLVLHGMLAEVIITGHGPAAITLSNAIMVQLVAIVSTKILLVAAVKNIQLIFKSDSLEAMGGIKGTKPATLVAFLMGTTGTIYTGIFVLDAIHATLGLAGSPVTAQVAFWMMLASFLFTATWTAFLLARVFGGKEVPLIVKNMPAFELRNENAAIIPMIVMNVLLFTALLLAPSISFIGFMLPV